MTLPDKYKAGRPSALKRAMARFREEREERHVAAMPSRFTRHRCAVTGEQWLTEWRADAVDGLYKLHRKVRGAQEMAEAERGNDSRPVSGQDDGRFDLSEFEWEAPPCESCGNNTLSMFCHHGFIVCGGRSTLQSTGRFWFRCDEHCEVQCPTGPDATRVAAETGQTKSHKALPKDRKQALPRQKRALPKGNRSKS